jgi:uncharacterized membrane protein
VIKHGPAQPDATVLAVERSSPVLAKQWMKTQSLDLGLSGLELALGDQLVFFRNNFWKRPALRLNLGTARHYRTERAAR